MELKIKQELTFVEIIIYRNIIKLSCRIKRSNEVKIKLSCRIKGSIIKLSNQKIRLSYQTKDRMKLSNQKNKLSCRKKKSNKVFEINLSNQFSTFLFNNQTLSKLNFDSKFLNKT